MSATRLRIVHDDGYPTFARPTPLRPAYGVCAPHLRYLYRDPFVIRRARRTWRQSLTHWWRSYSWIGAGLAALAAGLFFTGLVAAFVLLAFWRHGVIG
jgi:hypothetical protein